jgi:hypothetical protein
MRVILISCCSIKRLCPSPAGDLYQSPLFLAKRALAEKLGSPWFILSAEHGLLDPGRIIKPYDKTLRDMNKKELSDWYLSSYAQIIEKLESLKATKIYDLTSASYLGPNDIELAKRFKLIRPLYGLPIGRQLQWLIMEGRPAGLLSGRYINPDSE